MLFAVLSACIFYWWLSWILKKVVDTPIQRFAMKYHSQVDELFKDSDFISYLGSSMNRIPFIRNSKKTLQETTPQQSYDFTYRELEIILHFICCWFVLEINSVLPVKFLFILLIIDIVVGVLVAPFLKVFGSHLQTFVNNELDSNSGEIPK
jgi:hypothetical protein